MAVKRRKDSSNPNTVLVLFLVFFVILSIGLGVWGYYGQSGQEKLREAALEEKKKADAALLGERFALYVAGEARQWLGYAPLQPEDMTALQTGREDFQKGTFITRQKEKPMVDSLFAGIQKDLEINKQFGTTIKDVMRQMRGELTKTQGDLATAQSELKDANSKLQASQTKYDTQWKAALKLIDANFQKSLAAAKDKGAEMEEMFKRNEELKDLLTKKTDELEIETTKLKSQIKNLTFKIEKMKDQSSFSVATSTSQEQHALLLDISKGKPLWDAPLGKIVRTEMDGRTVTINLGSGSGVRTQLTFTVFAAGKHGRAEGPFKGTIEVTRILDANTSQARITSLYDENGQEIALNDPARGRIQREAANGLKEGDLLFHLAWGTHAVVAGQINWAALPTDNPAEQMRNLHSFMSLLNRQGVIVDGYLDLTNGEFKGGFSDKTRYMIRGDFLLEEKAAAKSGEEVKKDDEAPKAKAEPATGPRAINDAIRAIRKDASDKGVFIISADNFANVIGYREPRSATAIETGAFRPGMPAAGAPGSGVLRLQRDPAAPPVAPDEGKKENGKVKEEVK